MLYSELFASHLKQLKTGELSTAVEALMEKAFTISRTRFWICLCELDGECHQQFKSDHSNDVC